MQPSVGSPVKAFDLDPIRASFSLHRIHFAPYSVAYSPCSCLLFQEPAQQDKLARLRHSLDQQQSKLNRLRLLRSQTDQSRANNATLSKSINKSLSTRCRDYRRKSVQVNREKGRGLPLRPTILPVERFRKCARIERIAISVESEQIGRAHV